MAKPRKCISPQDAEKLFTHWRKTRGEIIKASLGDHDTCEFVLNISELREYLDFVEDESRKQRIANPGVRLYFGAYNDKTSEKATFFLAPTMGDDIRSENNYKIDAWNRQQGGWPPYIYKP